jgi:hypothetical protein
MKIRALPLLQFHGALICSSLFLLIPAFYNGYPLVNPDTATYLASGFKPETPFDRPITYGLLARLLSFNGFSLWSVVFAQSYLISCLLYRVIKALVRSRRMARAFLLIVLLLSAGSSLSWLVSQVQPDVFTPVGFLCIVLILIGKEEKRTIVLLYVLFFLSVAMHLSHPLLFCASLTCIFFIVRIFVPDNRRIYGNVNQKIAILILLSLASIAIMGPAISKSKHVFFVGSLLEKGVLKKYLDDQCPTSDYKICAYKDVLPAHADEFWWDSNSPLYKIGDWKGTKPEFNAIIHGVLTNPLYLKLYLQACARQAIHQLPAWQVGDGNTSFSPGSNVGRRIAGYLPRELLTFNEDRQNNTSLWPLLLIPNKIFTFIILLSVVIIAWVLARRRPLPQEMKVFFFICVTGIILNCLDCAAFTVVNGRYGCKMIWLLPFCALLFVYSRLSAARHVGPHSRS